jgi:WD40 repeat protein
MTNIGYSDGPRIQRLAGFVGWLLLLTGLGTIFGLVVSAQDERETQPDETDQPFAQAARDDHRSPVWSLVFSPDDTQLASATVSGDVWVKDLKSGRRNLIQRGPMSSARTLAFSADGRFLAVAGNEPVVRLWDVASGEALEPMPVIAENEATRVAFSRDGRHLATGGASGIITLWEWSSRRQLTELDGHVGSINVLAFSPDGLSLAASDSAGLVKLWDVSVGKERTTIRVAEPGNGVTAMVFSPDGARLATTSYLECSVRLWNVADGELQSTLPRTALGMRALGFSPDGTLLAMAGADGAAVLWDVAGARELGSVRANERSLQSVAFLGDGRLLATGGTDGYVRLWDIAQALGSSSPSTVNPRVALK